MKPRWLRHIIAIPSPSAIPILPNARASELVRRSTCLKLRLPASSTMKRRSPCLIAAILAAVAGVVPPLIRVAIILAVRSGRVPPMIPVSASTLS